MDRADVFVRGRLGEARLALAAERGDERERRAAAGGNQGCGPMDLVVSDPSPPQQVLLIAGGRTVFIDATTNDVLYHVGEFDQFMLSFEAV